MQVKLASLGWYNKSVECTKSYARRSACAVIAVKEPVFVLLRSSCSHVTEAEGPTVYEIRAECCHAKWRGRCKRNLAIFMSRFIGAFEKFRKASISFVMSVSPSVRPHGTTWLPTDGSAHTIW